MCYRIGDPDGVYPIFDATASRLYPGRWNTPASPMIYASEHYSTAMLEKLVHGSGQLPPNQHFIIFFFKQKTAYEMRESDWSSRRVLFRSKYVILSRLNDNPL